MRSLVLYTMPILVARRPRRAVYWPRTTEQKEPEMNKVLKGIENFRRDVYPGYEEMFRGLANRQHPLAMVITCADSRIDPNLLLQCEPGDLFVCRNAGNIVPPYDADVSGVAASVEYAIDVLQIRHII